MSPAVDTSALGEQPTADEGEISAGPSRIESSLARRRGAPPLQRAPSGPSDSSKVTAISPTAAWVTVTESEARR